MIFLLSDLNKYIGTKYVVYIVYGIIKIYSYLAFATFASRLQGWGFHSCLCPCPLYVLQVFLWVLWFPPVQRRAPRSVSAASLRISLLLLLLLLSVSVCSELKVLVRLNDGQITAETLESDSERDIISVEFRHTDGTLITFLADFKRHVKILRALVLGEPERGQTQYQGLCFISRLEHGEIIPSEAMVRLRQKNPHIIRNAEEKRGLERMSMNMAVNLTLSWHLSSHIRSICRDAQDFIYTQEQDVKYWLQKGVESSVFKVFPQNIENAALQSCSTTTDPWQPCSCSYTVRLEWYPCMLKYCRGHGPSPYKCGIKSCSKAYRFDFYTSRKQLCMWDEES